MVLVSHDRHLLRSVSDQFLLVDQGKVQPFNDDLDAYRQWLMQPRDQSTENSAVAVDDNRALNKKQLRQQQAQQRQQLQPMKKRLQKIEQQMQELQQQLEQFEQQLADPLMYQPEQRDNMESLVKQRAEASQSLSELEEEWLILSEEFEQLEQLILQD